MKAVLSPITAPLSFVEIAVLRGHVTQTEPEPEVSTPSVRVELATATQSLIARGMLAKTKTGIVVNPEGLAAILDTVPVEDLIRTGFRSVAGAAPVQDASTPRSRAPRRSAGRSSRRDPGAS